MQNSVYMVSVYNPKPLVVQRLSIGLRTPWPPRFRTWAFLRLRPRRCPANREHVGEPSPLAPRTSISPPQGIYAVTGGCARGKTGRKRKMTTRLTVWCSVRRAIPEDANALFARDVINRRAKSDAGHPWSKLPGLTENSPKAGAVSKRSYYLLENGTGRKLYASRFA